MLRCHLGTKCCNDLDLKTTSQSVHVQLPIQARNPSFSPFNFARRMTPCTCLLSTPICLQKSLITCECTEIALPLSLLNSLSPIILRTITTIGENGPPVDLLPMRITCRLGAPAADNKCCSVVAGTLLKQQELLPACHVRTLPHAPIVSVNSMWCSCLLSWQNHIDQG
eukprot:GHRR01022044.1.p1 GENE.GHRR01022044.1~~GHRR01022044.1.p1  ORF type:complete len:168 (-),score=4.91 GHRR01022044.1:106-609(-)